jgi:hypothetical protein
LLKAAYPPFSLGPDALQQWLKQTVLAFAIDILQL